MRQHGTIPPKSMREAVVYLTGMNQRELYGASYRVKEKITYPDLHARTEHVINRENDVVRNQLMRNRIEPYTGHGRFIDEHTVLVENPNHAEHITVMTLVPIQDFAGDERGGFEVEHPRDDVTDRAKPSQRMQTGQGGVIGVGVHRGVDDSR
jgi:hypothetical protein